MGIYCGRKIPSVHQSLPFPFTHMLANEVLCGAVGIISLRNFCKTSDTKDIFQVF